MTQEQKDKAYQWAEGFLKSQLFGALYRLLVLFMMVLGGPLIYFAITSTYKAVIDLHDQQTITAGQIQRIVDRADSDRTNAGDQFKVLNDRYTLVSGHVDKLRDDMERDFARKAEVQLGFQARDQHLETLDHRVGALEGRTVK